MQNKYVKVTEKGKSPFIALASNEQFYKNRGAKIEDPAREEIEKCFPEEVVKTASKPENAKLTAVNAELAAEKTAHDETKQKLETEILAHNETKQKLETVNAILQTKNEELEPVKSELEGLKKKSKKETDV